MINNFQIKIFNRPLQLNFFRNTSKNFNIVLKMSLNSYSLKKYYSTKQNINYYNQQINNYYNPPISTNDILSQLTYHLNTLKFQKIQKDYTFKRASVAAIIRVVPQNINQINGNFSY